MMKFHHREQRKMPFAFHSIKPHQIKKIKIKINSDPLGVKSRMKKKIVFPERQKAVTPLHREKKKSKI